METPLFQHLLRLAVHPDGDELVVTCQDGRRIHFDLEAGTVARVGTHPSYVCRLAWSIDGSELLLGARKGELSRWPRSAEEPALARDTGHGTLWGLAVHPDGDRVGTCGGDGMLRVWSLPDLELLWENGYEGVGCDSLGFAGDMVVAGRTSGKFEVFRGPGEDGGVLNGRVRPSGLVALAVRPQGDVVVLGAEQGGIVAVSTDLETMWPTLHSWPTIPPRQICVNSLAWSPDGSHFVAACSDGALRMLRWGDAPDGLGEDLGKPFWLQSPNPGWHESYVISDACFSPDGAAVYSCRFDGTVSRWDLGATPPRSTQIFSVTEGDVVPT